MTGVSFAALLGVSGNGPLAGCITTYYLPMDAGGPVAITIGWRLVGLFVLCVALAMAQICSAHPPQKALLLGRPPCPHQQAALGATITWLIGGRMHFLKDVPEGHDTKPASELLLD